MKKVIVVLGALAFSLMAQSATVGWGMTKVRVYGSTDDLASGYISYLLVGNDTAGLTSLAGTGATAISKYVTENNTYGGSALVADGSVSVSGYGNYSEATVKAYAVVFDASTIDSASHFYVTAVKDLMVPGSGEGTVSFGSQKTGTSSTSNWYSVASESTPEPTSGLLLMIGSAMLALRRRRA